MKLISGNQICAYLVFIILQGNITLLFVNVIID